MEFQQAIYLAAQIPAPQGPRFSPAPEVHIPQEQCGSALRPGRQGGWRPGLPAPLCPQLPTLRQSRKTWDPLFPATPWDPEDGSAPTAIPNPRTPVLTLSGPQPPTPQSLSIRLFLAAVRTGRGSSIMALVSRSRLPLHRSGREVGANSRPFPLLSRQATLPREARAGRCKAHTLSPRWSFLICQVWGGKESLYPQPCNRRWCFIQEIGSRDGRFQEAILEPWGACLFSATLVLHPSGWLLS